MAITWTENSAGSSVVAEQQAQMRTVSFGNEFNIVRLPGQGPHGRRPSVARTAVGWPGSSVLVHPLLGLARGHSSLQDAAAHRSRRLTGSGRRPGPARVLLLPGRCDSEGFRGAFR